jgi:hypothetical protein
LNFWLGFEFGFSPPFSEKGLVLQKFKGGYQKSDLVWLGCGGCQFMVCCVVKLDTLSLEFWQFFIFAVAPA